MFQKMATAPLLSGEAPPAYSETADPYPTSSRAPPAGQAATSNYTQPPPGPYPYPPAGAYNKPYPGRSLNSFPYREPYMAS